MISDHFLLDPVGEILYFESILKSNNKSIKNRAQLIYQYNSKKYADLNEIILNLPTDYIDPLLRGLEADIKTDIERRKKKYKLEIRKRENKSLDKYFCNNRWENPQRI
jgi:hypothetical protein